MGIFSKIFGRSERHTTTADRDVSSPAPRPKAAATGSDQQGRKHPNPMDELPKASTVQHKENPTIRSKVVPLQTPTKTSEVSPMETPANTSKVVPMETPKKAEAQSHASIHPEIGSEEIADRARALWHSHGQPQGRDQEFWYQAERELKTANS